MAVSQKRRNINKQLGINLPQTYPLDFDPGILRATLLKSLLNYVKKYVNALAGKKVCFIGGGIGREIIQLSFSESFYAVNTDINFKLLSIASCHYKNLNLECSCIVADGAQLPFKDGSFDIVFLYESLHHMDDLGLCLEESFRIGKTICIVDRRKCLVSKLGRRLGLIYREVDGFYAYELDIKWFREWLKTRPYIHIVGFKRHFLYLLVINKTIHNFLIRLPFICYLDIICVKIINMLFGLLGNGIIIVAKK
jgi:ubiquinone/menaquinone biosynthesis C-methylase UbiE